jgi:flagellar hook-associated protein 2
MSTVDSTTSSTSSTSATSSSQYKSGDQLTSLGANGAMQVTGLASGLDTDSIVSALMEADTQQVTNLQNQQSGLTAENTQLTAIQTALQTVANDAQALSDPSLFADTQNITSTDSTLIGASATGSTGAVEGGYQIAVTQLASASQRTFSYTSSSSADTVTIDGQQISVAAGASADSLVSQINSDSNLDVWATVTQESSNGGPATIVMSNRNTGAPPSTGDYIAVSDTAGALTQQTQDAQAGVNAEYTINGVAGTSSSNTISSAVSSGTPSTSNQGATETIPGVSLSLNGLTGSDPVSVDVGSPAPSTTAITNAVQQFVTDYNSALSTIQTQLLTAPSSSDPTVGTLYGDSDLQQFVTSMRESMDATLSGLSGSLTNMLDIGVSTGATTGSGSPSQEAIDGDLTLNTTTLSQALENNSNGVQTLLTNWSVQFSEVVNNEGGAGGDISTRISTDDDQNSYLATQISNLQDANTQKQDALVQEFADMESELSQSQSTSSWLTSQLSSLSE